MVSDSAPAETAEAAGSIGGIDVLRLRSASDARPGGILFVLAHPDDETFICGGTIARYASAGVAVNYVCATRGECGTVAPGIHGDRSIAEVRTAELARAARVLGLEAVYFLGYRDSGMPGSSAADHPQALVNAAIDESSKKIAILIRTLQPRIVVTHGPYGEYGHPDHIRLHEATLLAFRIAGDGTALPVQGAPDPAPWSPETLFVTTFNPRFIRFAVRFLRLIRRDPHRFGENADLDLVAIVDHALPATCAIDVGQWLAIRDRAFICHQTQLREQRARLLLPRTLRRWFGSTENYARMLPPLQPGEPAGRDLLQGLRRNRAE